VVSKLLLDRRLCLALTLGSAFYLLAHLFGFSLLECPIQKLFGKPCPGCGMTRAVSALTHGEWQLSLQRHLLAIPYLILFCLIGLAAILPDKHRDSFAQIVQFTEKRTYWPHLLAASTVVYFLTRLVIYY